MKIVIMTNNNYVLHQDNIYVIKEKQKRYPSLYKIKVLEITPTSILISILIENLDNDIIWPRMTHETFNETWEVIEQINLIPPIDYTNDEIEKERIDTIIKNILESDHKNEIEERFNEIMGKISTLKEKDKKIYKPYFSKPTLTINIKFNYE